MRDVAAQTKRVTLATLATLLLVACATAALGAEHAEGNERNGRCAETECVYLHGLDAAANQSILAHRPSYFVLTTVTPGAVRFEGQGEEEYEVHFQLSVKSQPIPPWPALYLAYTQRSFWIIGCCSSPFRETNHNPELFLDFFLNPRRSDFSAERLPYAWGYRGWKLGLYEHESNGRDDTAGLSRGWDRAGTVELKFAWGGLLPPDTEEGAPAREPERFTMYWKYWPWAETSTPERVDLVDYFGRNELRLQYTKPNWQAALMLRRGRLPHTSAGSAELALPLRWLGLQPLLLLRYWSGVGENLIDYDRRVHRFMVGVLLAR